MAKFSGMIGYGRSIENPVDSGIFIDQVFEHHHVGDVLRNANSWQSQDKVNNDWSLSNRISIVSTKFAIDNIAFMKYVKFKGVAWKITNVEVQHPRLIITLGGVYNGEQVEPSISAESNT